MVPLLEKGKITLGKRSPYAKCLLQYILNIFAELDSNKLQTSTNLYTVVWAKPKRNLWFSIGMPEFLWFDYC